MPTRRKELFKIKSQVKDMDIYTAHIDYDEEVKFLEVKKDIEGEEDLET